MLDFAELKGSFAVITLPRYIVHGESRYHVRSCDEKDLDVLVTYLPLKLNSVICEADVCNAYVLMPSCSRNQVREKSW